MGMRWYDWLAVVYDPALEAIYRKHRRSAAAALDPAQGHVVLDVPCGTGQSFRVLHDRILPDGHYVGVDASRGMLARARARGRGRSSASFLQADARTLSSAQLQQLAGRARVDRLHIFLGLTTMDAWEDTFAHLWELLEPGGRCLVVDVYAERPGVQGRAVEVLARADLSRRVWEPFEARAEGFDRQTLSTDAVYGGELWLACGRKPG